jgi:hypothetical protein
MAGRKKHTKKSTKDVARRTDAQPASVSSSTLLTDLQLLIRQTREQVAQAVNSALVLLNWEVGCRIHTEVLGEKRAVYGDEILSTLSKELVAEFGRGYSVPNLSRMMSLAEYFPERGAVIDLSKQLGWSHFVEIIPIKDRLQREFYTEMCRVERWSVRTLRNKIGGMLFERTALSRKPKELPSGYLPDRLAPASTSGAQASRCGSTCPDPVGKERRISRVTK